MSQESVPAAVSPVDPQTHCLPSQSLPGPPALPTEDNAICKPSCGLTGKLHFPASLATRMEALGWFLASGMWA